ncbi:MAG: hypothetical protein LBV60_15150 [Streptomyces sp.]|jgi:hypothetical protein|nr:hypothetical protein [Streptomyces sp.]
MAPFVALGWRPAMWETACTAAWTGGVEDGPTRVPRQEGGVLSAEDCRLLADAGRADEAIVLLAPRP